MAWILLHVLWYVLCACLCWRPAFTSWRNELWPRGSLYPKAEI